MDNLNDFRTFNLWPQAVIVDLKSDCQPQFKLTPSVINKVIYTGKIKKKNHSKYHLLSNIIQKFFISIFYTSIVKVTFFFEKNQTIIVYVAKYKYK